MAKLVLAQPASGSIALFKAEIVNATIKGPVPTSSYLLLREPHSYYCVRGEIKNPLFPLNQHFFVEIRVIEKDGKRRYITSASQRFPCPYENGAPFPELEKLSLLR